MRGNETEHKLQNWRYGQAQAERLTAAILHLENYEDVDPQHPLGGPDGLKDVICRKEGHTWVAAAYFPRQQEKFSGIKKKFLEDMRGAEANSADGFAFFVNQHLTVGERQKLLGVCTASRTEIYHLERILSLLNAPKGAGIRLEYLRIPMTEAEQWAFWHTMNTNVVRRLAENEKRRDVQMSRIDQKLDLILSRTTALVADLRAQPSSLTLPVVPEEVEMPTASLSLTGLCWLHRIVTEDLGLPEAVRGRLRNVRVWIGKAGSLPDNATYVPPNPEMVVGLVSIYLDWWHKRHVLLRKASRDEITIGLAEFHHRVLQIHPFVDANGRVARSLLDQATRELLNQGISQGFRSDPNTYYSALMEADKGNLVPLRERIAASLE